MDVLVVNAGSSSLKLRVVAASDEVVAARDLDSPGGAPDLEALGAFLDGAPGVAATGHRVVDGGPELAESALVDEAVVAALDRRADLARHNDHALAALASVRRLRPELPAVACFDTTFHASIPPAAAEYAIPRRWADGWSIRRYGFHGLNHGYVSRRAAAVLGRPAADVRLVTCHLGSGASRAAVAGGRSVDTTMGFTPLDGLVMSTRSGSIDPGAVLWLAQRPELSADEVERVLTEESGLLGLSGRSGDMRELLEASADGDEGARLAVDVYLHRLRGGIAAMAAAMGGLDALVFTGGVGENAAAVRSATCEGLRFLGVELDGPRNEAAAGDDVDLSAAGASVRVLVVRAREELEIARQVREVLDREQVERARRAGG